jgi:transketolase
MNNTNIKPSYNDLSNAVRVLSIDMVEKAKSGHPGMPMGMADIATVLLKDFLRFNPKDPTWFNRDRFIVSNGHGSALLYSCLYLSGYEKITLEELKRFRQLGSLTPGHPEYSIDCGIETTTGPLGQGLANAVGIALSERHLNAIFGYDLVNHKTYVFCGDGCLMEGISHEAVSFAGHYKLKNLIVMFDDNEITIDGPTSLSTSDNQCMRFQASNWNTMKIDGNDHNKIKEALTFAQNSDKPVFIACKTVIGFGSPNRAGSNKAHGSPLGVKEANLTKKNLDWNYGEFEIPSHISDEWRAFYRRNISEYESWLKKNEDAGHDLSNYITKKHLKNVSSCVKKFKEDLFKSPVKEATRVSSGKLLNELLQVIPNIIGGSADLTESNNTYASCRKFITATDYTGSYVNYGIREHAMVAIMNGISAHGALIPYGGTFLTFSDYARPGIRLSALMKLPNIYVMTHDSIGLGEDGPTHQPIEHLASFRAMPNINVFRPADSVETAECWELALLSDKTPSILSLTRQQVNQVRTKREESNKCTWGAYILRDFVNEFKVTIFSSGSELNIALETADLLESKNIGTRVISVPCMDLFLKADPDYMKMLTVNNSIKVAIEAGVRFGWERLIGENGIFIGMSDFGASAPATDLYEYFGITASKCNAKIFGLL